MHYLELAPSLV